MKYVAFATVLLAVAASAFAGGNPNPHAYIDFDNDYSTKTFIYVPSPYETFNAYVCVDNLEQGMTAISFMLSNPAVDCPGVFAPPSFTNLLPGDLAIGAWNTGITLASTECVGAAGAPDYGHVAVGYLQLFYLGGSCCLKLLDHPGGDPPGIWARWVVDCNDPGQVDYYCIESHGDIGSTPGPGGVCWGVPPELDCPNPIDTESWGVIKSLYR